MVQHSKKDMDVCSTGNIFCLFVDTATVAMPSFEEAVEQLAEIHDLEVARPWVWWDSVMMIYLIVLPEGCVCTIHGNDIKKTRI